MERFLQNLETIYQYGEGLTRGENQNRTLAFAIFQGLCYFHPDPSRCLRKVAELLEEGRGGVEQNLAERFELLHYAATHLKDDFSLFLVAVAHLNGIGTRRNENLACSAFDQIWRSNGIGRYEAGMMLGRIYMGGAGTVSQNAPRAMRLFEYIRKNAEDDCLRVEAAVYLGDMFRMGCPGVKEDARQAVRVYMDAASLQCQEFVQYELAQMLESGEGFPRPDIEKAKEWYSKAAALGHEPSLKRLQGLRADGL